MDWDYSDGKIEDKSQFVVKINAQSIKLPNVMGAINFQGVQRN